MSVLILAASWVLFDRGRPGTPIFPDLRPDYGVDSTVTVYLPDEAPVTWSSANAIYEPLEADDGGEARVEQDLNLSNTLTSAPTGPLRAVVEFRGAARVDEPTWEGRPAEAVELGDRQLVLIDLGEGFRGTARVRGIMRLAPLTSENSRTSFASPTVGEQKACADLGQVTRRLTGLTYARWASVADNCQPTSYTRQAFIRLITGSTPVRVDYLETDPLSAGGSPTFLWKNEGPAASLRVRSSYVDIDGEAVAQRSFFLAGVAAGLATAWAPTAVQSLSTYVAARRARRRATGPARRAGPRPPKPSRRAN